MEQMIVVEQAKVDLSAIIERVRDEKSPIILTDKGKSSIKICLVENELDDKKGKRLGGFLKNTDNTPAPDNFDRLNEDEIFALFSGEYDELNKKSPKALSIIQNFDYNLYFSSVNLWEISIKSSLNKPDFNVNPEQLANGLLYDGFEQLYIENKHLYAIKNLPHIHKDPFDRLLLA